MKPKSFSLLRILQKINDIRLKLLFKLYHTGNVCKSISAFLQLAFLSSL